MSNGKVAMINQGKVDIEKSVASLIEKITPHLTAIVNARAVFYDNFSKDGEYDMVLLQSESEKEMEVQGSAINSISESLEFWEPVVNDKPSHGAMQHVIK